uniref:Transposase (Putative), gypsy type n=1 Tax=Tanacetum cinerariifolium TaxID=118510 RepID=A0A699GX85_TANCI|nr:hypothetical protein [Tanacetum cinerariifolium]
MSFRKCFNYAAICYTKPLDSLKNWNNRFFWVDDFACPASFPWHTAKHVIRDPAPVTADFNAQDYATLVAHPFPFQNFPEAFMCLIWTSLLSSMLRIIPNIPLLLIAHDRAKSEWKEVLIDCLMRVVVVIRWNKKIYAGGWQDANIQPVVKVADTIVKDAAPVQSRRQRKRKSVVVDAGGASYPPKKLREDHETLSEASIGGKSCYSIQRLLAEAVLNAKVRITAIPTLHFVTASVSTTPERKDEDHTDSVAEPNLHTIEALRRFVISLDSSHHSGTNVAEAEVDYLIRSSALILTTVTITTATVDPTSVTKEKVFKPSLFGVSSSSAGRTDPGVFSDLTDSDFLVCAIRTVINPDTDLQKVYFFASIRKMEHDQLFTEFNVRAARQMSLSAEVRMRAEYNVKEKRRLKYVVESQGKLLKAREEEIRSLKARLLLKKAEAAKAIRLRVEASNFKTVEKSLRDETNSLRERNVIFEKERDALDVKVIELETSNMSKECQLMNLNALVTFIKSQNDSLVGQVHELEISSFGLQEKVLMYENCMEQLEKFQDDRMKIVKEKFDKLYTYFVETTLHLEEQFYPYLLTTISYHMWPLTHVIELAIAKVLTNVAANNPSTEADYISTLQQLQNVNFPLFTKLKSNKDASVKAIIEILCLEDPVAEKLGLNELQPNVDQLMVPIHSSPDKVIIGTIALSLALDASSSRVQQIRENIVIHRSVLRDVFVSLSEPFSTSALTGVEGNSGIVPATATITSLSTTLALNSTINPIFIDIMNL